jgi:zinc transport system substrate-binding protein
MRALPLFASFPIKSLVLLVAILASALVTLGPVQAFAAPPKVVASIKPVQALVKAVMGELGDPVLLIPATASPHQFSLKPSQARTLEDADVVFWIGPQLEIALSGPLEKLASSAQVVELLKAPRLRLLNYDPEDADHENEAEHGHDHNGVDPHIWLSPSNARALVSHIADVLSQADPANADTYEHNADQARQKIGILARKTMQYVAAMRYVPYLVQHDGYGYLALEFGFNEVGHIQTTPGREPGAKHVADIMELIKVKEVKCLLHEPQFPPKMAQRLQAETGIAIREVDPMGTNLPLSEDTYLRIIQDIISSMELCLQPRPQPSAE